MYKFLLVFIFQIAILSACNGQEQITRVTNPVELTREILGLKSEVPKEIEGLQWNKWTSKNFHVLSLNDVQAQYLHRHLEMVKEWTLTRYGFYNVDFSVPCMILCVDDPALFQKLFRITKTKVEVRRENGVINKTVIFLLIDGPPSETVPIPLTEVCLAEFSARHKSDFSLWTYRGLSCLNGSIPQIKQNIALVGSALKQTEYLYFSKGILELNRDNYLKESDKNQQLYDASAMVLCLMIRKEFGQDALHEMIRSESPEASIKTILGFSSYDEFDKTLKRYMEDLSQDVAAGKTPDYYLQVREKSD